MSQIFTSASSIYVDTAGDTMTGALAVSYATAAGASLITVQNTDTSGRSRFRAQGNDGDGLVDYRNSGHSTSGVLLASQAVFRGSGSGGAAFGAEHASGNVIIFSGGTASGNQRLYFDTNGNIVPGTAAINTNATNGFQYMITCAGAPSGTPATTYTGRVPFVYDSSNNKIYVYNGAWVATGALA